MFCCCRTDKSQAVPKLLLSRVECVTVSWFGVFFFKFNGQMPFSSVFRKIESYELGMDNNLLLLIPFSFSGANNFDSSMGLNGLASVRLNFVGGSGAMSELLGRFPTTLNADARGSSVLSALKFGAVAVG